MPQTDWSTLTHKALRNGENTCRAPRARFQQNVSLKGKCPSEVLVSQYSKVAGASSDTGRRDPGRVEFHTEAQRRNSNIEKQWPCNQHLGPFSPSIA